MNTLRRSLTDRLADLGDWIDYRKDASFWFLFAVPPLLAIAWAYGGEIGLGIVLIGALLATALVSALAVCGVAFWLVARVANDAYGAISTALARPVPKYEVNAPRERRTISPAR